MNIYDCVELKRLAKEVNGTFTDLPKGDAARVTKDNAEVVKLVRFDTYDLWSKDTGRPIKFNADRDAAIAFLNGGGKR